MHQQQTASENIEGKGEIARNERKKLLCGKGLTLSQTSPGFYVSAEQVF